MGDRTGPVILTLLLIVVIFALMWWGWRNKLKHQSGVASLPQVPQDLGPELSVFPGQYVATTTAGDWLDRIAVHGLGIRTGATLSIHPGGVLIARTGSADIFIASAVLREVGMSSGMVGKFVEKNGLVVLTWELGELRVDTGFRTLEAEAKRPLVEALQQLLADTGTEQSQGKIAESDSSRKNDENE